MMWLSNFCLVLFLFVNYFHFETCESTSESRFKSLSTNLRLSKLQRSGHFLQKHIKISCPEGEKLCLLQIHRSRLHKEKRRDKRCCRQIQKSCKRKAKKRCRSRKRCLIRQNRRCRRQHSRCSKRKSTNRRPGNCETQTRTNINERKHIRPSFRTTTTTKPIALKREKEECKVTEDCESGLCCARHQHLKICKPLIKEGQVCKKDFRHMNKRSPEMYERCPCESGLTCASTEGRHNTCQVIT